MFGLKAGGSLSAFNRGKGGRKVLNDSFYPGHMATQIGLIQIIGTVGGICFYRMDGKYYPRKKSKLSGERVKSDPVFAETMRYAKRMGSASKIASVIYRQIVPLVMKELATDGTTARQPSFRRD